MEIIEIEKTLSISDFPNTISISTSHRNFKGTESYHIIDIPENGTYYDHEWRNESKVIIGKPQKFLGKSIQLYSQVLNINPEVEEIQIDYLVNDIVCYEHYNEKKDNPTPSIILTLNFQE